MIKVNIDEHSGFCFGVQFAIDLAEDYLKENGSLYSLGALVHNETEVNRLNAQGLTVLSEEEFRSIKNETVLIRAHGEPPSTYKKALENGIRLIDASCPVVLKLQRQLRDFYSKGYQIIIYGKQDHAEVIGLNGQCNNQAIVISDIQTANEAEIIFSKKTILISQTTASSKGLQEISTHLKNLFLERGKSENFEPAEFIAKDTLCRQVSNRDNILANFATQNDIVVFVSGRKSSNGKVLFQACKVHNERSYFIQTEDDLQRDWFYDKHGNQLVETVGVCGATSTPMRLIRNVATSIENMSPTGS